MNLTSIGSYNQEIDITKPVKRIVVTYGFNHFDQMSTYLYGRKPYNSSMSNDWKILEQLVAIIEKSIDPETQIEYNKRLPVIGSKTGRICQCDVILRKGPAHRETLTIIEVQHRKKPLEINTFRGWVEKMKEVGAQHLYCVSVQAFPKSVVERARDLGNAVKLIYIGDTLPNEIPLTDISFGYRHFDAKFVKDIKVQIISEVEGANRSNPVQFEIGSADLLFSKDGSTMISVNDICLDEIAESNTANSERSISIRSTTDKIKLYVLYNQRLYPCSISFRVIYSDRVTEHLVNMLSYTQTDHGALAWIAELKYQSHNREDCVLRLPITKVGESFFTHGLIFDPKNAPSRIHFKRRGSNK